ncbi:uncharacterized protein BDV14DRAFT_206493 [Aspergillus stella-maris]|uniref:uncharacterized protein n=1 Tax=Aspergillus stella-maris TaxID=1810926 RepID=UPI003CCD5C4A
MLILFAATAAARTAAFVPVYIVPFFFQFTRGDDAFDSGVRLLPFIVLCIFTIIANGALISKFCFYMLWYTFGGALFLTGGALFYTVDIDTSVARIYGYDYSAVRQDRLAGCVSGCILPGVAVPNNGCGAGHLRSSSSACYGL